MQLKPICVARLPGEDGNLMLGSAKTTFERSGMVQGLKI